MTTERKQDWGGRREGAGRKATWKSGPCKPVKLPVALVEEVVRYARGLDAGEAAVATAGDDALLQRVELLATDLRYTREELAATKAELAEHERAKEEPNEPTQQALALLRAGLEDKKKDLASNVHTAIALLAGEEPEAVPRSSQLMKLVDEKIELRKQVEHLQDLLAQKNKKLLLVEDRERKLQAAAADARSVLRHAYGDGRSAERKPLLSAMRSAMLALGLDVDR